MCYHGFLCKPVTNKNKISWQGLRNKMKPNGFWDVTLCVYDRQVPMFPSASNKMAAASGCTHWYLSVRLYNVTSQKTSDSASTALWEPPENVKFYFSKEQISYSTPKTHSVDWVQTQVQHHQTLAHLSVPQNNSACRTQNIRLCSTHSNAIQQNMKMCTVTSTCINCIFCTCYKTL